MATQVADVSNGNATSKANSQNVFDILTIRGTDRVGGFLDGGS